MRSSEPGMSGAASPRVPTLFVGMAIVLSQLVTPKHRAQADGPPVAELGS